MEEQRGLLSPNTHVFNHLLTAYARAKRVDEALAMLEEMWGPKRAGARPDTVRGYYETTVDCYLFCLVGR